MATGVITIKNPNGKSGTIKIITVGPNDECDTDINCLNKELTYVDPQGNSGVQQGGEAVCRIVNAGNSGIYIAIDLQPKP